MLPAIIEAANRYPWGRFFAFNAAGGIVWATLYGSAAYLLGHSIHRLVGPVGMTLLVLALVVGIWAWRSLRLHQEQLQAEANAAIPGAPAPGRQELMRTGLPLTGRRRS